MKQKNKTPLIGLAKPEFRGDKKRLIQVIHGTIIPEDKIPFCFSDPCLESGMCNPNIPLKENEPGYCAFAKSCLVAKALALKIPIDSFRCREREYNEILAECDTIFDLDTSTPPTETNVELDRQFLRGHVVSISLVPPRNPFRKKSLRRIVLDILSQNWISLSDLYAAMLSLNSNSHRLNLTINQVTSISSQEEHGYRIVESFGKYKAFSRE